MLVADDEAIARKRLVRLLAAMPDVAVAGECADAHEVLERVRAGGVDVVLLDIQMPELSGLEALQLFPADGPVVIFCTAHTAHAVAAFDVGAIDYLLKPIEAARLRKALERARDRDARRRYRDELARFKSRGAQDEPLDRLALPTRQGIVLLDPATVSHAELDGELVTVHTADAQYLSALSLQELESRLPGGPLRARPPARAGQPGARRPPGAERGRRLHRAHPQRPRRRGVPPGRARPAQAPRAALAERARACRKRERERLIVPFRCGRGLGEGRASGSRATISAMRATTASADIVLESISMASSALRSGAAARVESRGVAGDDLRLGLRGVDGLAGRGQLGDPPARALVGVRGEEELRLRVGEHDGADVAPLDHHAAAAPMRRCSPSSAARTSGSAETRDAPSDISGVRIAVVTSWPFSDDPVDRALQPERDVDAVRQRRDARAVVPGDAPLARAQRHRPIDRAGVEQRVAEPRRQQPRRGRLPRPRRPVDRDDQSTRRARVSHAELAAPSRSCGSATDTARRTPCRDAATWRA